MPGKETVRCMNFLEQLSKIYRESVEEYERIRSRTESLLKQNPGEDFYRCVLRTADEAEDPFLHNGKENEKTQGIFVHDDNLALLAEGVVSGRLKDSVDMIYCDPPFFTKLSQGARRMICSERHPEIRSIRQTAFEDRWNRGREDYLRMLTVRLLFMKDTLRDTGSIFLHLDWHAGHAVKLLMDEIFGEKNFVNEIIWTYKSGGATKRHFARKHDMILFYAKTEKYKFFEQKEKSYNRELRPYNFKGVQEYQDETGWYTLVNQKDVWMIDMVGRSSGERMNYATQKPEALISRMIEASTEEGDLCADFFSGSGTLAVCAAQSGRHFLCADSGELAVSSTVRRLTDKKIPFALYEKRSTVPENAETLLHPDGTRTAETAADTHPETRKQTGRKRTKGGASEPLPGIDPDVGRNREKEGTENPETDGAFRKPEITVRMNRSYITLSDYRADLHSIPVRRTKMAEMELLLRDDPLVFIDFWSIGYLNEKEEFRPVQTMFRDRKGRLETKYDFLEKGFLHHPVLQMDEFQDHGMAGQTDQPDGERTQEEIAGFSGGNMAGQPAILAYDLFGRSMMCLLEI